MGKRKRASKLRKRAGKLRKRLARLEGVLDAGDERSPTCEHECAEQVREREEASLRRDFWVLLSVLASAIAASIVALVRLVHAPDPTDGDTLTLSVAAGFLGSALAATLSLLERRAHGFELDDGQKLPRDGEQARFSAAMAPFLLTRPLLGAGVGLLLGAGLLSGALWPAGDPSVLSVCFVGVLGGFLAKTALAKLKTLFDNLLGL